MLGKGLKYSKAPATSSALPPPIPPQCMSDPPPPQDEAAQRVSLMTLHSAKGLEFQNVFFVGFEDGLVPYFRQGILEEGDK